ncbi:MAG: EFR1 family ferrodoxin [Eubacteriales bacterium]|nr:EFR1 family ferrodoxin [Eubacteriales bacterium]
MNVVPIVFSPTGGTQNVVDALTAEWEMASHTIDLTNAALDFDAVRLEKDAIAVIAVPSYGGRVPALAAHRIAKIHGNQARCILVVVYGNRAYEDTLLELKDLADQSGFQPFAAIAAIAEHSIMHQYAAGRPDQQDKQDLKRFAGEIQNRLHASDGGYASTLSLPGNHPYKKSGGTSLVPKANKKCTHCGLCAENCPAQAIRRDNLNTADSDLCISCMRCVVQCPQSARQINRVMVAAAARAMKKACSERKNNALYL